uniref:Uncharacterized protein n=1 Tax=viral metagenome TaxID=1070528 RepID=A0A6M3Y5R9_9ZZZZ
MDTKDKLVKIFEKYLSSITDINSVRYFEFKKILYSKMADEIMSIEEQESITDEMIEKWAKDVNQRNFSYSFYEGLIKGAKWMKDKLKTK